MVSTKLAKITTQAGEQVAKAKNALVHSAGNSDNKFYQELSKRLAPNSHSSIAGMPGFRNNGFGMSGFNSNITDFLENTLPKASEKLKGKSELANDIFELVQK
ncbi:hypothetical protein DBY21_04780 [Candidatus Gastranaerophilales bacterium]|nr:MAG: hypothetical protein DBY21_04780 [Candidatus Gastranaerophilales bacterium]